MELLELIDLEPKDFIFFCSVILLASFVRGFSGFGFSSQNTISILWIGLNVSLVFRSLLGYIYQK